MTSLLPFFEWLLRATCQASLLIALVLLIQKTLGRRLGVRGRYYLWFVVLARMAMPWAPESGLSVHNLLPSWPQPGYKLPAGLAAGSGGQASSPADRTTARKASGRTGSSADDTAVTAPARGVGSASIRRLEAAAVVLLPMVWLGGACLLAGCIVTSHVRLRRVVRRGRPATDPGILDLLEECRKLVGVRPGVDMIAIDGIASPALFGVLRPRLLLPRELLSEGNRSELRHIFLHELAHHKRHDILIGHVASVLHVLHWFNPLIAFGLRQMRADLELACDGLALSLLAPEEAPAYGRTIVHQIERLLASPWRSPLPALCGDRTQIKRRIAMISAFEKGTYRWSPLAAALLAGLACAGLTDGLAATEILDPAVEPPSNAWDAYARRNFRTTHRDKHANIQRCCLRNIETGKYLVVDGERVVCDADEPGEAGLWEYRFDEVSNTPADVMYYYSVAARKYLTSDEQGNLAVNASEPVEAARWGNWPRPEGVWLISHRFKDGYLRLDEQGQVSAVNFGRDSRSYWDVHSVWRIKTSDDPRSNPQWQREHVPGPD